MFIRDVCAKSCHEISAEDTFVSVDFEDLPAGTTTNGATQFIVVEFLVEAVLALQGVEGTD